MVCDINISPALYKQLSWYCDSRSYGVQLWYPGKPSEEFRLQVYNGGYAWSDSMGIGQFM